MKVSAPNTCWRDLAGEKQGAVSYPGYDQAVKLRMTTIKIQYLHDAIIGLVAYLLE